MIQVTRSSVVSSRDGEVFYGRPAVSEMSPRDAITRIFRAYGSGRGPEFQIRRTAEGRPLLRMLEFPIFGDAEQVFFTGPGEEMEILTRAADRLATAKPDGNRTRTAMMLREGITLSVDIDRGLELTISELGLALESHRCTEMEFGRIVDMVRAEFSKKK